MAELFGFKFERIKDSASKEKFTEPSSEDGTLEAVAGGFYGQLLDQDGRERTEQDLIRRYRDIAQQPECDSAIEDIINEGIVSNEKDQAVSIELDRLDIPDKIKLRIMEEFESVDAMIKDIGSRVRSMPQIKINGELIGGYNQLIEHYNKEGKVDFKGAIINE